MTAKEILKDLVAINTIADKDNVLIMDYIEKFFAERNFSVKRIKNEETEKEVLIAKYGEEQAIGFLGHTDTVAGFPFWPFCFPWENFWTVLENI